jgi:hypothetical protein
MYQETRAYLVCIYAYLVMHTFFSPTHTDHSRMNLDGSVIYLAKDLSFSISC